MSATIATIVKEFFLANELSNDELRNINNINDFVEEKLKLPEFENKPINEKRDIGHEMAKRLQNFIFVLKWQNVYKTSSSF